MKPSEIREKSVDELRTSLKDLQRELWQSRFDNYTNQLDDTAKVRRLRRDVARVKTILAQREAGAEQQTPATERTE